MHLRLPVALASVALAFTGGLASARWLIPDAHAQAMPLASTVYVPSDGLAFRSFDGRIVARLSYDSEGGSFELYDQHEQPAARVRGGTLARPAATSRPPRRDEPDLGF